MAKLRIRTDEDPILRKKSREVSTFDDHLRETIKDMFETMYDAEGVGLAAVQVGKLKRLIVIDDYDGTKMALVNPVRIEESGEDEALEACLSVPERAGKVKRYNEIRIKYQNEEGAEQIMEAKDFLARILQHEMDHLDGILYIDIAEEVFDVQPDETEEE